MTKPRLTKLELKVMECLWRVPRASIREIQESFPAKGRPAYTTVQTVVYRLEAKKAGRRGGEGGGVFVVLGAVARGEAQRKLIDDLLALFGGSSQPVMAHLIESGKLTLDDVKEAEKLLRELDRKEKTKCISIFSRVFGRS